MDCVPRPRDSWDEYELKWADERFEEFGPGDHPEDPQNAAELRAVIEEDLQKRRQPWSCDCVYGCSVLLDPESSVLPGHVCLGTCVRSVERFVRRFECRSWLMWSWGQECPLPIGEDSICRWAATSPSAEPGDLPLPLVSQRDAQASLIVERRGDNWQILLYGLQAGWERPADADEEMALRGFWLRQKWGNAILRVEATSRSASEEAHKVGGKLLTWFNEQLAGRTMRGAPRKPRYDRDRLRDDYYKAIAAARGRELSVEILAGLIAVSPAQLYRCISRGELYHPRDITSATLARLLNSDTNSRERVG